MLNFKTDAELVIDCFDKLIAQGGCSYEEGEGCKYRGKGGRKCAVGQYIPDEYYSITLERKTWAHPRLEKIFLKLGLDPAKFKVLQTLHDDIAGNSNEIELLEKAKQYLLSKIESGVRLESVSPILIMDALADLKKPNRDR